MLVERPRKRRRLLVTLLLLGAPLILCGGGWLWLSSFAEVFRYDCDRHSPTRTMRMLLHEVPPGVSDIRAAGDIWIAGAFVFMRFRATDEALRDLTRDFKRCAAPSTERLQEVAGWQEHWSQGKMPLARDGEEHQVHWRGLQSIAHPAEFHRAPGNGSEDYFILDRDRHLVYYFHNNI